MFVTYDSKGMITNTMSGPDPKEYGPILEKFGHQWFYITKFGAGPRIHLDYVDLSSVPQGKKPTHEHIKERPKMPLHDDGRIISGIPQNAKVRVSYDKVILADEIEVTDGWLEFDPPTPGTYELVADCWPYQTERLQVTR